MTRLYKNILSNRFIQIKNKTRYLQQNILSMLCISLLGFLSGNLFGTILNSLRKFMVWDGFIITSLILVIEIISYFSYKPIIYNERHTQSKKNWTCSFQDPSLYKSKICSRTGRTNTSTSTNRTPRMHGTCKGNANLRFAKGFVRRFALL